MAKTQEAPTPEATGTATTQGTTELLFPERKIELPAVQPEQTAEQSEEAGPETPPEEPTVTPEDYLDIEAVAGKKVKVKIDGVEGEVDVKELLKGYQTAQHISRQGFKIGEQRRELERMKQEVEDLRSLARKPIEAPVTDEDPFYTEYVKPAVEPLRAEIARLEAAIGSITPIVAPLEYQKKIDALDSRLREQGYEDFKSYQAKIEAEILSKPSNEQALYDTPQGFELIYKDLKLKEAMTAKKPQVLPDQRPTPKISKVETSSTSSGVSDAEALYAEEFEKAKKTGNWSRILHYKDTGAFA